MNKVVLIFVILSATTIFAERPDWYPENPREVEAKCAKENSIDPATMTKILSFDLEDTPSVRGFLLCSAKNKNIYTAEEGFIPERFQYSLTDIVKMDCKIDVILDCDNKYKDLKPEDVKYFNILKCAAADRKGNCKPVS